MRLIHLDREARIRTPMPIEMVRRSVVEQPGSIKLGTYYNKKRAAIYRGHVKVATVEMHFDADENLSDVQIREVLKTQILRGTFDKELTEVYQTQKQKYMEKCKKGEAE
jgi:hypothetical protein